MTKILDDALCEKDALDLVHGLVSDSSTASNGVGAKLTSVLEMLGKETKMSHIANHIGTLQEEARSIGARINKVQKSRNQPKYMAEGQIFPFR